MTPATFLTIDDLAAHAGISARRVRQLVAAGRIPVTRVGRQAFIRPRDAEVFVNTPRVQGWPRGRSRRAPVILPQ